MKVTIVYPTNIKNIKAFCREISRKGIEVTVIAPRKIVTGFGNVCDNGIKIPETDFNASYRVIPVDLINKYKYNFGFCSWQLSKALKEAKPDIIHILNEYHCFMVSQVIIARNLSLNKKIPIILYAFQNIDYWKVKKGNFLDYFKWPIRKLIIGYNMRHIKGATVANSEALNILRNYGRDIKLKKIFWGVDTTTFYPRDKLECRRKLNLPLDKKLIGYLGRIIKEKGIDKLLRAVDQLNDVYLLIVGSGKYLKEIRKLAEELAICDRIILRPFVPSEELGCYYNSLDCFVLASQTTDVWKEQYGRSLAEAMACGIPIAGSSSGAIPEVLKGYSMHLIFNEGDILSLTHSIKKLLNKEGQNSNQELLKNFTIENFTVEHIQFYQSILKSNLRDKAANEFTIGKKNETKYINIFGIHVSSINLNSACEIIERWIENKQKVYVCIVPVSTIVSCQSDKKYLEIVNNADMVTPDGMPLVWLGRLKGNKNIQRTYGLDLMLALCKISQKKGYRHYLYGGQDSTLALLENKLKERFRDLNIVGKFSPPYRSINTLENDEIIEEINRANPDILWVGLGSPKQDYWVYQHRNKLNVPVMIGIGAAFDFLAGTKLQAPRFMRNSGFEWLFRLITEPKRLWKRYLIGNSIFLWLFLKEFVKIKILRKKSDYD